MWGARRETLGVLSRIGAVVGLSALMMALVSPGPAIGRSSGLPLPNWLEVEATLSRTVEVGRPVELRVTVKPLLSALEGGSLRILLPPEATVLSGERETPLQLEQGALLETKLTFRLDRPATQASLTAEVRAPVPRDALLREAERRYAEKPLLQREALRRLIEGLPGDATLPAYCVIDATREEGFSGNEATSYRYYHALSHDGSFAMALLEPGQLSFAPAPTLEEVERQLADIRKSEELAEMMAERGQDEATLIRLRDQIRYSQALRLLKGGRHAEAAPLFERLSEGPDSSPEFAIAAACGLAAILASGDRLQQATGVLNEAARRHPGSAAARYLEFNLGEVARASGRIDEARTHFERALDLAPAYTAARARLTRRQVR